MIAIYASNKGNTNAKYIFMFMIWFRLQAVIFYKNNILED